MTDKQYFVLSHALARHNAMEAVRLAPEHYTVTIQPNKRTLEQNALLWPLLEDIARQVEWYGQRLTAEEWKDVFTAGLRKSKVVPDITGTGFVIVGQRTSQMNKREFSELIELIYAFGAERRVKFRTDTQASDMGVVIPENKREVA
ncbi:MAG: recombination protein NinB [Kiritimatiellia bacterium]